jgi:hypothetical protein
MNGLEATAGLVLYIGRREAAPQAPAPPLAPAPLNAGELTVQGGPLCQGKPVTVHASASDPAGHTLSYAWKLNDTPTAGSGPDFSFTPNNSGDFKVEVAVTDAANPARTVAAGPKTITVQEYSAPQISSVTASPSTLSCAADPGSPHTANLSSQANGSACGGSLTYKWTVTEGSVARETSPNATFDSSTLSFDSGGGQSKTVTVTLTVTDEAQKSASQTTAIAVNCPPQFKRLADIVFAKNSARVNNCGKRILIDQAAPQAGAAYDIVLVAHRSADEREQTGASRTLDERRALNAAAVLAGDHGTCANIDLSTIKMDAEGTDQTSTPDPGLCGASNQEKRGEQVTGADKERRVEVYLVPKGGQAVPPAAKHVTAIPEGVVKALGCPR